MYEIYQKLLESKGLKNSDVSKATGVSNMTLSDWKNGKSTPKADKLQKIADFFDVSIDFLITGEEQENYYVNDDARELAEFLHKNPEYKVLFNASRNVKREDIEFVKTMLDKFRQD